MNTNLLILAPVLVLFVTFVIYAGVVMPAKEIAEALRNRARPPGPDAEVIDLDSARTGHKAAA
ncbi:hypothetical protein [Spirillospora sp. CA-294931]|uniref:hypothetical protein n=1 Tax=Spirillospora sp. CA-294931 TaxID=3240042 RepID=UPI003D8C864C